MSGLKHMCCTYVLDRTTRKCVRVTEMGLDFKKTTHIRNTNQHKQHLKKRNQEHTDSGIHTYSLRNNPPRPLVSNASGTRAQAHTIMMHGVVQSKGGVAILRGSSDDDGRSRLINLTIKETRRFHKWGCHNLRLEIRVGVTG